VDFRARCIFRTSPPDPEARGASVRVTHGVDGSFEYAYEFGPAPALLPQAGGDAERRAMLALTSALAANRPALVSGPAGAGKRTLLLFLLNRLGRQFVRVDACDFVGREEGAHALPYLLHCLCESGLAALISGTDRVPPSTLLAICGGLRSMFEAQTVKLKKFDLCGRVTRMGAGTFFVFLSRRGMI